ncbi:MAG: PIN domain-containing protein [Actinomycetota bacterium]
MGRLALDSDSLIAVFKIPDKHHKTIVNRLFHSTDRILISTIALSESLVYSFRVGLGDVGSKQIRDLAIEIIDVDQQIATFAAELRAVNNLKLGDALISATAILHKCTLLTFDEKLAKRTPGAELLVS